MSRYLLLFLINLPLIILAISNTTVNFKLGRSSKRSFAFRIVFWLFLLLGLALAQPLYSFLFTNNLTESEPLSLFDVVQITSIVVVFYLTNRSRAKIDHLEHKVQALNQEISIKLSKNK